MFPMFEKLIWLEKGLAKSKSNLSKLQGAAAKMEQNTIS
jgi:hypothetical protein